MKAMYAVTSPLDQQVIGQYEKENEETVTARLAGQRQAFLEFRKTSLGDRLKMLKKAREEFINRHEEIVQIVGKEIGKPHIETLGAEIIANIELFDFYLQNAAKILKAESLSLNKLNYPGKKGKIEHAPLGIVAVISSWNYPVALSLRAIIPALVAANAVAFKPHTFATGTGLLISEIFEKVFPKNVFCSYVGGREVNQALAANANKLNFIGSVDTGRALAKIAAENFVPVSLELSGKDAAIVLEDCDLNRTVNGIVWGAFTNAGQNCASIERVFVEKSIAPDFLKLLVEKTQALKQNIDIGPVRNETQATLVEKHLNEARSSTKAEVLCGGRVDNSLYFKPAIIHSKDKDANYLAEETFGPTLAVLEVSSLDEAVELVNESEFGLTTSIWTKNIKSPRKEF